MASKSGAWSEKGRRYVGDRTRADDELSNDGRSGKTGDDESRRAARKRKNKECERDG